MSILISLFFISPCSFHFPLATPFCCPSSSPFAPLVTKLDTQILPYAPLSCPRPVRSPLSPVNQSIVILLAKFSSLSNGEREREREREIEGGNKSKQQIRGNTIFRRYCMKVCISFFNLEKCNLIHYTLYGKKTNGKVQR